jgi:hypothetical protein
MNCCRNEIAFIRVIIPQVLANGSVKNDPELYRIHPSHE